MIHHCRLTSTAFLHQVGAKVNSSADSPDPADPADQVSLSAARSLPSTRAGGQDDVSFNKLPQINNMSTIHIGVRGLPARGIFSWARWDWGLASWKVSSSALQTRKKCKTQNVNLKMKNIPQSLRVAGSLASRQGSIVAIRKKLFGFL